MRFKSRVAIISLHNATFIRNILNLNNILYTLVIKYKLNRKIII